MRVDAELLKGIEAVDRVVGFAAAERRLRVKAIQLSGLLGDLLLGARIGELDD